MSISSGRWAATDEPPNVCLSLSNRAENVLLVREMLIGVGEMISLEPHDLHDIRIATTEACNNVVEHAYEGEEGPLEIEVLAAAGSVEVVVRDHGNWIHRREGYGDGSAPGIGMRIIQALARRIEVSDEERGTEVRMEFLTPPSRSLRSGTDPYAEPSGTTAPPELAVTVIPRLLSVLAAWASFPVDRIADVRLAARGLCTPARGSLVGHYLGVAVSGDSRDLVLHTGRLRRGNEHQLIIGREGEDLGALAAGITGWHPQSSIHRFDAVAGCETLALHLLE